MCGPPPVTARTSAILESARTVVTRVFAQDGIELAEPVRAGFRDSPAGSTGVAITIRLSDPSAARAARAAFSARFGGGVDVLHVA